MLEFEQGKRLVELARNAVETKNISEDKNLSEKRRVFVTIDTFPKNELRGCIGFPDTVYPLWEAVQKAAMSAAYEDLRFSPLKKNEFDKVVFEVSVMTEPEEVNAEKIKFGDGVVVEFKGSKALYLPQVWEKISELEHFLNSLCLKAGVSSESWKDKNAKLWRFKVQAFKELEPRGEIISQT